MNLLYMMNGNQNLSKTKEEVEEDDEEWEVSSRLHDEIVRNGLSNAKHGDSIFYECDYGELRERKLKEGRSNANLYKNLVEKLERKTIKHHPRNQSEKEIEIDDSPDFMDENGRGKFANNRNTLLNDLLLRKVKYICLLFLVSVVLSGERFENS